MNITGEVDHIVGCAENGDTRIVLLGRFVFFSTEAGDAWMLEPRERLALCLMQGRERQPFRIVEDASKFAVGWDGQYHIDGSAFIVTKESGEVGIRLDYPTEQIVQMTCPMWRG
jgi:hypothetical protein